MKLHILHRFVAGPYGGGNQFLKALRHELERLHHYEPRASRADCLLVNANPGSLPYLLRQLLTTKQPVIVRLDGPISLVRGKDAYLDRLLAQFITLQASGVVFQSAWSKEHNQKLFNVNAPQETVIHNAPDPSIFFPLPHTSGLSRTTHKARPLKIIATSWSTNARKGFALYQYLDTHLDFSRYAMTFVGNSPLHFQNIQHLPTQSSEILADTLRQHDLYLTASINDPCSNALLEALACGLPVVARHSGGHPELVHQGGQLFQGEEDVLRAIDAVAHNLTTYQQAITPPSLSTVAKAYVAFAEKVIARPRPQAPLWLNTVQSSVLYTRYYGYHAYKLLRHL